MLVSLAFALSFTGGALAAPLGQVTTFPAPATDPVLITPGGDGNLWFTDNACLHALSATCAIGRMTATGTITEFTTGHFDSIRNAATSNLAGIARGPDGNVWFSDSAGYSAIGRITPSGTITEFSAGLQRSNPQLAGNVSVTESITVGDDRNLWFTDAGCDRGTVASPSGICAIGQITPSGTITEFGLATGQRLSGGITAGPDGNVWFTESPGPSDPGGIHAIGRITPSGAITEFALPAGQTPGGITTGADGNVWFIVVNVSLTVGEAEIGRIGRITPSGGITEFFDGMASDSMAGIRAGGITASADGNLWFTGVGSEGHLIGRFGLMGVRAAELLLTTCSCRM